MRKGILFLACVLFFAKTIPAQQLYLLDGSNVFDSPIVIEEGFFQYIQIMERLAVENNLQLKVQQSFRRADGTISGNIVPPAERSNHLVGHAIDINIVHNGVWYNSSDLALSNYNNLPQAVRNFISGCESAGIRWGGRFSPADPVHFDSGINVRNQSWYDRWYAGLQQLYVRDFQYETHK